MGNTEGFDAFICKVQAAQLADRSTFRFEQEVNRCKEEMDVLGIQKVWQEGKDQTQRDPKTGMDTNIQRNGAPAEPEAGNDRCKWLPRIWTEAASLKDSPMNRELT